MAFMERREEARSAEWRGAGKMLGALLIVLILAAILFPVFVQSHHSGANKVPPRRVAYAIQAYHKENDAWPETLMPVRRALRSVSFSLNPHIAFLPLKLGDKEAEFVIAVDGNLEVWRIPVAASPERVGARAVAGVLHPGA